MLHWPCFSEYGLTIADGSRWRVSFVDQGLSNQSIIPSKSWFRGAPAYFGRQIWDHRATRVDPCTDSAAVSRNEGVSKYAVNWPLVKLQTDQPFRVKRNWRNRFKDKSWSCSEIKPSTDSTDRWTVQHRPRRWVNHYTELVCCHDVEIGNLRFTFSDRQ